MYGYLVGGPKKLNAEVAGEGTEWRSFSALCTEKREIFKGVVFRPDEREGPRCLRDQNTGVTGTQWGNIRRVREEHHVAGRFLKKLMATLIGATKLREPAHKVLRESYMKVHLPTHLGFGRNQRRGEKCNIGS